MTERTERDAVVIGAGVGGLVAAGLLARAGRDVLLLEAHATPGGCAGYYEADGFAFDAGATTLVGFDPGDPLASVAEALGLGRGTGLVLEPVDGVDVRLPSAAFFFGRDEAGGHGAAERLFPGSAPFFERLRRDAGLLWEASRRWPVLPVLSPADLVRGARLASPRFLPLVPSFGKTVADLLASTRAPEDAAFRAFLDLALLITVQSPATAAPWWNGALGVDLFRRGVSRARGGMRAFASALASAVARTGGEIRYGNVVTRLRRAGDRWVVRTASGEEHRARAVLPNLPVAGLARLLDPESPPAARAAAEAARLGGGWGALALNLGLSRVVNPDARRLHRLVSTSLGGTPGDGSSLFLSFSPPADPAAPPGGQTLSVSTHVPAGEWAGLRGDAYRAKKEEARLRLRGHLAREVPGLDEAVVHESLGTPRTFLRYTRRTGGEVGGLRASRATFGPRALDATLGEAGLHVVGDTAFPGQGTLAVAISAVLAAERLGAVRLGRDGRIRLPGGSR